MTVWPSVGRRPNSDLRLTQTTADLRTTNTVDHETQLDVGIPPVSTPPEPPKLLNRSLISTTAKDSE